VREIACVGLEVIDVVPSVLDVRLMPLYMSRDHTASQRHPNG
jgi:hypothetical protein